MRGVVLSTGTTPRRKRQDQPDEERGGGATGLNRPTNNPTQQTMQPAAPFPRGQPVRISGSCAADHDCRTRAGGRQCDDAKLFISPPSVCLSVCLSQPILGSPYDNPGHAPLLSPKRCEAWDWGEWRGGEARGVGRPGILGIFGAATCPPARRPAGRRHHLLGGQGLGYDILLLLLLRERARAEQKQSSTHTHTHTVDRSACPGSALAHPITWTDGGAIVAPLSGAGAVWDSWTKRNKISRGGRFAPRTGWGGGAPNERRPRQPVDGVSCQVDRASEGPEAPAGSCEGRMLVRCLCGRRWQQADRSDEVR